MPVWSELFVLYINLLHHFHSLSSSWFRCMLFLLLETNKDCCMIEFYCVCGAGPSAWYHVCLHFICYTIGPPIIIICHFCSLKVTNFSVPTMTYQSHAPWHTDRQTDTHTVAHPASARGLSICDTRTAHDSTHKRMQEAVVSTLSPRTHWACKSIFIFTFYWSMYKTFAKSCAKVVSVVRIRCLRRNKRTTENRYAHVC
jgi:hypothetical protein